MEPPCSVPRLCGAARAPTRCAALPARAPRLTRRGATGQCRVDHPYHGGPDGCKPLHRELAAQRKRGRPPDARRAHRCGPVWLPLRAVAHLGRGTALAARERHLSATQLCLLLVPAQRGALGARLCAWWPQACCTVSLAPRVAGPVVGSALRSMRRAPLLWCVCVVATCGVCRGRAGAAFAAGAASSSISTPAELLMIQQQRTGESLWVAARRVGMRQLYRGLVTLKPSRPLEYRPVPCLWLASALQPPSRCGLVHPEHGPS